MSSIAAICLLATLQWADPPAVRTGGVVNAASHMPSMLPGAAIARGALFEILGVRLGTSTQTTTVTLGKTLRVPLLEVSPQRIAARMPADAPPGRSTLTVTVDGAATSSELMVVRANFGIYSRNGKGWGPASQSSARPGDTVVLTGTGSGDSTPEVWVGSRRAVVESVRRGTGRAADELRVRLPADTPGGCFVPIQARQGGMVSNTVTIAVHDGDGACEPPPLVPAAAWSGRPSGVVVVTRTVRAPSNEVVDEGAAVFGKADPASLSALLLMPPLGTCTAYAEAIVSGEQPSLSTAGALAAPERSGLDAGSRLSVARGNVRLPISPVQGAAGVYRRIFSQPRQFLDPGNLTVAGAGGADVGPFALSLPAPEPIVWENRDAIGTVDRKAGVTLRWRPLPPRGVVLIGLTSIDAATAWSAVYCAVASDAGSFTIPPAMLANLPASNPAALSTPSLGLSYVPPANQRPLTARGLDGGAAISMYAVTLTVAVR